MNQNLKTQKMMTTSLETLFTIVLNASERLRCNDPDADGLAFWRGIKDCIDDSSKTMIVGKWSTDFMRLLQESSRDLRIEYEEREKCDKDKIGKRL